jgi:hypothetical protein
MPIFKPRCGALMHATIDGRGAPNKIITVRNLRPRSCVVARNGYHDADTWNAEFDLRVLPFDPETIASIAIRVYMWEGDQYDGDTTGRWAIDQYEMVRGLADDDTIHVDRSRNRLNLSGRDFTALLDPEWDPRQPIRAGVPLMQEVQRIADSAAPPGTTARFLVVWQVVDENGVQIDPNSILSNGSARSTKTRGMWVKQGKTTWDVIYDLVIQNGFICFVRDSTIVITTPRSQMSGDLSTTPVVTYGRDLSELEVTRKMARKRIPRVRISYWDAKLTQKFEVVYPAAGTPGVLSPNVDPTDKTKLTLALGLKKNEDLVIPAPPYCHDQVSALRHAKMRWESMAREESTYKIKTRFLTLPRGQNTNGSNVDAISSADGNASVQNDGTSTGGQQLRNPVGAQEFDMLQLQAGQAISVRFDPFNKEEMRSLNQGQRTQFLVGLGYEARVASFVAQNFDRLDQFTQPYYVKKAEYTYSHEDGLEIEVTGENFTYERQQLEFADSDSEFTGANQ